MKENKSNTSYIIIEDRLPSAFLNSLSVEQLQLLEDYYSQKMSKIEEQIKERTETSLDFYLEQAQGKELKLSDRQKALVANILKEGLR